MSIRMNDRAVQRIVYLFLLIVVLTREALVVCPRLATFAGNCFDFFFGAIGEVAGIRVAGGHLC